METYPSSVLPLPSASFNVESQYSNVRTQMDSGRVRQRPRYSRELELAKCTFELTRYEYGAFVAFWDTKINRGNDWFNMDLPTPDGEKLTTSKVRFVSDYTAQHMGDGNFNVSATIEFDEAPRGGETYYDTFIHFEGDMDQMRTTADLIWAEVEHYPMEHGFFDGFGIAWLHSIADDIWDEVIVYGTERQ